MTSVKIIPAVSVELVEPRKPQRAKLGDPSAETISCIELQNNEGQMVGALLEYSPEQSQALIKYFKSRELHSGQPWNTGKLHPSIVDQLGGTAAQIASGLQTGNLMRVVGPPELIQGIQKGVYQVAQSGQGSLGVVKDISTGKIAGNLRFAKASAVPILAPVVAWQVLHAIVGTQQLNQINQRLAAIEHCLAELHVRQEAMILGEIHYAINVLDDILHERMNTGVFTADSSNRLAQVEKTILSILERNRLLVERFRTKAQDVKKLKKKKGAQSAASLLKSDGPQAIHDMQCLVGLIAADLKLEQALLLLAMQNNPTDVGRRQKRLQQKMETHRQIVENLPSVQEIKDHAQACVRAMSWWESLFDFGSTKSAVQDSLKSVLEDIYPDFSALKPSLGGYIFWQDADGTHVFSMSGDDLVLQPTENIDKSNDLLKITISEQVKKSCRYQFKLPESKELVEVEVTKALEDGLWWGVRPDDDKKVMICHQDYGRPKLK
ncbi:hypothetical protein ACSYAD_05830 [Acaryochloris marina NIES-2412]|uniref:hypothetical protein n=1 Tax=Acaryochloris marina TaxID=155978 RepID=UPI00405A33BF